MKPVNRCVELGGMPVLEMGCVILPFVLGGGVGVVPSMLNMKSVGHPHVDISCPTVDMVLAVELYVTTKERRRSAARRSLEFPRYFVKFAVARHVQLVCVSQLIRCKQHSGLQN